MVYLLVKRTFFKDPRDRHAVWSEPSRWRKENEFVFDDVGLRLCSNSCLHISSPMGETRRVVICNGNPEKYGGLDFSCYLALPNSIFLQISYNALSQVKEISTLTVAKSSLSNDNSFLPVVGSLQLVVAWRRSYLFGAAGNCNHTEL